MASESTSSITRGSPSTYSAHSFALNSPSLSSPDSRKRERPLEETPSIEGRLKRACRKLDFDDPELFNPWKALAEPGLKEVFSGDFLQALDQQNLSQKECTPIALILRPEQDDERSALSNPHVHFFILQVAKVYRTAIKIVRQTSDVSEKMREAFQTFGLRIDLLLLIAHGSGREILLGNPEPGLVNANLNKSNISTIDFKWLSSKAQLMLFSCKAGLKIAQLLADASKRPVSAFKNSMQITEVAFIQQKHGPHFVYFDRRKEEIGASEIISKFYPGKSREVVHFQEIAGKKTLSKILAFFSERTRYLKNLARSNNPEASIAQYALVEDYVSAGEIIRPRQESAQKAFEWLILSAQNGYPFAQYQLGRSYYRRGDQQSKIEALKWFESAANNGCVAAEYQAALIYLEDPHSLVKALKHLKSAAKKGHAGAQFHLAVVYRDDQFRSDEKAFYWLKKASENGHAGAQFHLAAVYQDGQFGEEASDEKAFYWLRESAENGHAEAQFCMMGVYQHGLLGEKASDEEAFYWLRESAENGYPQAQYSMSVAYRDGQFGKKASDEKAFYWLQKAAGSGWLEAQYSMASVYLDGYLGEAASDEKVLYWLQKAAENGHVGAQYRMAAVYFHGRFGEEVSNEKALYWVEKAAENGCPEAQYIMADIYLNGRFGEAASDEKALYWLQKAAENGYERAKQRLLELSVVSKDIPPVENIAS